MKKQEGPASLLAVSVVAILAVAEPASADDQFRHLNGKQIRPKLIGRDLTDGVHWTWYYRPDGTLVSVEMGKRFSGSWKIEDDKLCNTNGRNKQVDCYEVWASGNNVSLRFFADAPAIEAVVVPHTSP